MPPAFTNENHTGSEVVERSRTLGSACSRSELDEASETARCDVRHLKRDRAERSYLHKLVLES